MIEESRWNVLFFKPRSLRPRNRFLHWPPFALVPLFCLWHSSWTCRLPLSLWWVACLDIGLLDGSGLAKSPTKGGNPFLHIRQPRPPLLLAVWETLPFLFASLAFLLDSWGEPCVPKPTNIQFAVTWPAYRSQLTVWAEWITTKHDGSLENFLIWVPVLPPGARQKQPCHIDK